ncbi:MAG TPA: vitamin K epoxide reductase family protein [Thermoplasmata archaeon]|nr:vitamin K epoxide reductase family protein [Thermoplasmata archaeon]
MQVRTIRTVVYLSAGLGLIVALFAAAEFFEASLRSLCSLNTFFSCSTVDQSGKTTTLGIPDYVWGVGGFVAILGFAGLAESRPRVRAWSLLLLAVTTAGVALALYLLYVELALIGALCIVCATAYFFGFVTWLGAIGIVRHAPENTGPEESSNDAA